MHANLSFLRFAIRIDIIYRSLSTLLKYFLEKSRRTRYNIKDYKQRKQQVSQIKVDLFYTIHTIVTTYVTHERTSINCCVMLLEWSWFVLDREQ